MSAQQTLLGLEQHRRSNRAPHWAPWLGDAPTVVSIAIGLLIAAVLVGHAVSSIDDLIPGAGNFLVAVLAMCVGLQVGVAIPRHCASGLYRDWLQVLPIEPAILRSHWRRCSIRLLVASLFAGCATCVIAGSIAGIALLPAAFAALSMVVAAALAAAATLSRTVPSTGRAVLQSTVGNLASMLRPFESRRIRHLGLWQLLRSWDRSALLLLLLGGTAVVLFCAALGRAQQSAWPIVASGVLVATSVFNRSLDGSILSAAAVRVLPLSRMTQVLALLRVPLLLSLIVMLTTLGLGLAIAVPGHIRDGSAVTPVVLGMLTWLLLSLARLAACIGHPASSARVNVRYLILLLSGALLAQHTGPAGVALFLVFVLLRIRHAMRAL